ncbi:MAG: hypothetical protein ACOH2K_01310 [Burkholderiaceae bacterium]
MNAPTEKHKDHQSPIKQDAKSDEHKQKDTKSKQQDTKSGQQKKNSDTHHKGS